VLSCIVPGRMPTDVAVQDTAIPDTLNTETTVSHWLSTLDAKQKFHTEIIDIFKLPGRTLYQQDKY